MFLFRVSIKDVRLLSVLIVIIAPSYQPQGNMIMNHKQLCLATLLTAFAVGSAEASNLCDVAEKDRQPVELLQQKLESEGWQVKNIKIDDGCYEAYAIDTSGARVEAYFDPQTFQLIKSETDN
jgi:hypothetical protein